jgi:pimeloyl-ACP methyl ester carboxylesterase
MSYAINNGLKINYEMVGQGEPLVMLHPNGHCIKDWHALGYIEQLEKYFQLILIDSRGHGDSDKPHDPKYYQPQLIASDTIVVLNTLKIDKAYCFGYSMGGRNAFALMQYYPDYFMSFIIGGAHPYQENKLLNSYIGLLQQGLPKLLEVFEKNFGSFPSEVRLNFLKNDVNALLAINSLPLVDFSEALISYKGNVSFIVGGKDPILNYVKRAQQSKENSKIHIIPHQNHMQLFFDAEIITSLLLSLIRT